MWPRPCRAQDLPDSGLPDGAVDMGGADRMTEEADPQGGPCLVPKDCPQAFTCVDARCVPAKPKTVGCTSVPAVVAVAGAIVLLARRRRRA